MPHHPVNVERNPCRIPHQKYRILHTGRVMDRFNVEVSRGGWDDTPMTRWIGDLIGPIVSICRD